MGTLGWIVVGGVAMSALALVGALTLVLSEAALKRLIGPLVALAAGSLLGGALFHMLPEAVASMGNGLAVWAWAAGGFAAYFFLEQVLHWHHCHKPTSEHRRPLTYLLLVADGLHNFIGGLAVGAAFLVDLRLGLTTWLVAAAHEVPQELGDFGVLVHGGWSKARALAFNLLSASTFLLGGVLAWAAAREVDVRFLVPFAAGNFIYIAAADLVPEVRRHPRLGGALLHFFVFVLGLGLLVAIRLLASPSHVHD